LRSFTSRRRRTTIGNMKPTRYNRNRPGHAQSGTSGWMHAKQLPLTGSRGEFFRLTSSLIGKLTDFSQASRSRLRHSHLMNPVFACPLPRFSRYQGRAVWRQTVCCRVVWFSGAAGAEEQTLSRDLAEQPDGRLCEGRPPGFHDGGPHRKSCPGYDLRSYRLKTTYLRPA